jgi:putative pyruvate formate lyase activating enzyme
MLDLEQQGAHNINLVTPTHYSDQLLPLLERARPRLGIPFVWNSNGYEKPATLRRFEGLVSVWLPDLKYSDDSLARRFSSAPDYFRHASAAIIEMKRQAGPNRFSADGTLQRGMIVRHLVLPGQIGNTLGVLDWLRAELGSGTLVSLMAQYYPTHRAAELPGMDRRLSPAEYATVRDHFESLGFEQGFIQQLDSASRDYTPDFSAGE